MSARNRPRAKKIRKLRKALRRTPIAWVDVIEWLKLHRHAQTTGQARKIILAGRLRSESRTVGRVKVRTIRQGKEVEEEVVERLQPASLAETLHVVKA